MQIWVHTVRAIAEVQLISSFALVGGELRTAEKELFLRLVV
jgi:hypothetical protein